LIKFRFQVPGEQKAMGTVFPNMLI